VHFKERHTNASTQFLLHIFKWTCGPLEIPHILNWVVDYWFSMLLIIYCYLHATNRQQGTVQNHNPLTDTRYYLKT